MTAARRSVEGQLPLDGLDPVEEARVARIAQLEAELAHLRTAGARRRDAGAAAVDAAVDDEWRTRARARLDQLAATGEPFTADDVVREVGIPARPNAVGALFLGASRARLIERTGALDLGTRAAQHARRLPVWTGRR